MVKFLEFLTKGPSQTKKIGEILETRVVVGGMKNKLSANMVKFHLMNNYNWKDSTKRSIMSWG